MAVWHAADANSAISCTPPPLASLIFDETRPTYLALRAVHDYSKSHTDRAVAYKLKRQLISDGADTISWSTFGRTRVR